MKNTAKSLLISLKRLKDVFWVTQRFEAIHRVCRKRSVLFVCRFFT